LQQCFYCCAWLPYAPCFDRLTSSLNFNTLIAV
jgi:hypothetical protein